MHKSAKKGVHLFVLCHGFQGKASDLRLVKNQLIMANPSCIVLLAKSNEEKTDDSVMAMG